MNRAALLARILDRREPWDMAIVGGGATGMGVAVDAASRGYEVALLEQSDFGKGTSSRSTKLVHGGVRYLEQGNLFLVMEALRERGRLRHNAPHLVHDLPFIVPRYQWWEGLVYGLGLTAYSFLSGRYRFGESRLLSRAATLDHLPNLRPAGLRGGVLYHDGQFDDARLLINLAATAVRHGAALVNYAPVTSLTRSASGRIDGVRAFDVEGGRDFTVSARVVINAAGALCDPVRRMADPHAANLVAPSQGTHLVFPGGFLPGDCALMVPHTSDGRVVFAIPWHGHTLVGTTDTPLEGATLEPVAQDQEIDFLLETVGRYLSKAPTRQDILSVFAGIRPLVRRAHAKNTAALSRDHTLHVDRGGLITVTGGKWTTYRNMAEDCVNQAIARAKLPPRTCVTRNLHIHGHHPHAEKFGALAVYGADAPAILQLIQDEPRLGDVLHRDLPYRGAEVIWAVRQEMARTVEDVLARRTRALFLNAAAASAMAAQVADLMAIELDQNERWRAAQVQSFKALAQQYQVGAKAPGKVQ